MSPLGKAFALAALFCPLVWAVECELDEECEIALEDLELVDPEDETSLLQTQQNLEIGRERWPIGEDVHDEYAITDSTPDGLDDGEVQGAFHSNMDKIRHSAEAKVASDLKFDNMVHEERKHNYAAAQEKVAATHADVIEAMAKDSAAIAKVKAGRKAAVEAATARVDKAKENAEAHHYKEAQAKAAAVAGRVAGARQAAVANRHAREDMAASWKAEDAKEAREAARKSQEKAQEANQAAVNQDTSTQAQAEQAWVKDNEKWKRAEEAKSAAEAALEENSIEGPEGMKNHELDTWADEQVAEYTRSASQHQHDIDADAKADWPEGYWPAGP